MKYTYAMALIVLASGLLAGCGSSDSSAAPTGAAATTPGAQAPPPVAAKKGVPVTSATAQPTSAAK